MATINLGRIKPVWQGQWAASTAYVKDDIVKYDINSYICVTAHTSGSTFSTGDGWELLSQGAEQGGFQSMQVFTGNGTWTRPAGVTKIKVYVTGGGGGGGIASGSGMSGGAAGGTAIKVIDVSSITSVSVTVGNGGSQGNTGGTSSFGSYCSANGGGSTQSQNSHSIGGSASGGDMNIQGGNGITRKHTSYLDQLGGNGGGSYWGSGGSAAIEGSRDGTNGTAYGSGGGGYAINRSGGSGRNGIVVIEEYK